MAASIVIPTPPGAGNPVSLTVGKVGKQFRNAADAMAWSDDVLADRDVLMALAIRLAARSAASRGKTLTIDLAAVPPVLTLA